MASVKPPAHPSPTPTPSQALKSAFMSKRVPVPESSINSSTAKAGDQYAPLAQATSIDGGARAPSAPPKELNNVKFAMPQPPTTVSAIRESKTVPSGLGSSLTDTPLTTAPSSPRM
ncbi:MAG: hypothetical protein INR71_13690 [Terriglobus roseus]|nr:hypothetical protein [Terriglobus roseus]